MLFQGHIGAKFVFIKINIGSGTTKWAAFPDYKVWQNNYKWGR